MEISVTRSDQCATFKIRGEIDEKGAEQMKASFKSEDNAMLRKAVFDIQGVTHIGSAGLGKLLLFYKSLAARGGVVEIQNPSHAVFELLKQLKLDAIFNIVRG